MTLSLFAEPWVVVPSPEVLRIAFTANRNLTHEDAEATRRAIRGVAQLSPAEIITGGARGGDTVILQAAHEYRVGNTWLVVIVPDTVAKQPYEAQQAIRECADEVVELKRKITRDDRFEAFKYRNRFMVDRGNCVGGVWNGDKQSGTYSALHYAEQIRRPIWVLGIKGNDK